jgi:hypothetical protein
MGFCYEELGRYEEAAALWSELAAELTARGLTVEAEFPAGQAKQCQRRQDGRQ